LAQLLGGPPCFGRVAPQQVEVQLIAVGLTQKGGHRTPEALQLVKLSLHDAVDGFDIGVVGGAVGRIETVLAAAVLLLDELGERWQAVTAIPVAPELAAIVGLNHQGAQIDAAAGQMSQQTVGKH
jgi:hypothetical protein